MNVEGKALHPLMARDIGYISTWEEWQELWQGAKTAEQLIGLLHVGFWGISSIVTYLEIADGHRDHSRFRKAGEFDDQFPSGFGLKTMPDIRQIVAEKAFAALCQKLFRVAKDRTFYDRAWSSLRYIIEPGVFKKVLWFFRRSDMAYSHGLYNLGGGFSTTSKEAADDETARAFILGLCRFGLTFNNGGESDSISATTKRMFEEARPALIDILDGLGEVSLFLTRDFPKDEQCLATLEKIALRDELWFTLERKYRKPKTIEEACYTGSWAAQVLLILRTMTSEEKRLDAIRALELQRTKTDRRLQELRGK